MERKQFISTMAAVTLLPSLFLAACKEAGKKDAAAITQTYTCPMHPQVIQEKPGTCPVCGMDLVPFDKNNKDRSLTLDASQVALANITTLAVGPGALPGFKQLNGRLTTDPGRTVILSSRVPGRIEALYVKETGVKVNKGEPLYKIYSEELASLQQEYLLAAAQAKQFPDDARFQQIEKAARQKLVLYDQSDAQIKALLQSQRVSPYVTYPAAQTGVVAELSVTEGQYVPEGGAVMRLEGYQQLWVEADVYPTEAAAVAVGQTVKVIVAGWEQAPQTMTVQFINPVFQSGTQLMQLRGTLSNPDNRWQPGLQASVLLPVKSSGEVLRLPVDAVIRDARGAHVWIETARRKFEPRSVTTGIENFDAVEITAGLENGEKVVVTGAYLLYSEYLLKKGGDPIAGVKH